MDADSGGGTPPDLFGSRFRPLLDDLFDDWKIQKKTKSQKRTAARNARNETEFMKQQRFDTRNNAGRFLILSRTDEGKTMDDLDPFFIQKSISTITSNIKIERYKEGTLLLKTLDRHQADKMLKQTMLGINIRIKVVDHPTMNSCKGTIYCPDLKKMTDDSILKNLESAHVIAVKRMQRRGRDGSPVDTGSFILTFNLPYLPDSIDAGFHNCKIRHFIPNPIRCMNCLNYGHKKENCKGNQICAKCANLFHGNLPCATQITCISCRGDHSALSRECPIFLDEFEIQRIRVEDRVSLKEAKQKRRARVPDPRTTLPALQGYAAALKHNLNATNRKDSKGQSNHGKPQPSPQPIPQPVDQQENQQRASTSGHQYNKTQSEENKPREQRNNTSHENQQQPRKTSHENQQQPRKTSHSEQQQQNEKQQSLREKQHQYQHNDLQMEHLSDTDDSASPSWADMMDAPDEEFDQGTPSTISIDKSNENLNSNEEMSDDSQFVLSQALRASMFCKSNP